MLVLVLVLVEVLVLVLEFVLVLVLVLMLMLVVVVALWRLALRLPHKRRLSWCLDSWACLSYKSPFLVSAPGYGPAESESARHALAKPGAGGLAAGEQSDHLTYAEAYKRWAAAACTPSPT